MRKWRIIPRLSFINYKKNFPNMGDDCFNKIFNIHRAWGGRLIYIHIKHFAVELDFRYSWINDLIGIK